MDGRLKIERIFLSLRCEDSNSYHLYRSVHVDVRQEWLPNSTQQFGVETQNLLFHSRRALGKSTQEEKRQKENPCFTGTLIKIKESHVLE